MTGRFEGKTVIISGAAIGQGRSHAVHFAAEGANLVLFDICATLETVYHPMGSKSDLDQTLALVRDYGASALGLVADVRNWDQIRTIFDQAILEFGTVDVVVANAGIATHFQTMWETSEENFRDVIDINLVGAWHTLKAAAQTMLKGGTRGSIVVTGSGASIKAPANISSYVATKHALVGLVRSSARELAASGIRVNLVAPGNTSTTMLLSDEMFRLHLPGVEHPTQEMFEKVSAGRTPMQIPYVEPEDISHAVMFLASDEARYITGSILPVDGGGAIP
jgi:SDR family mycofactocin-dependent oxidoreductase